MTPEAMAAVHAAAMTTSRPWSAGAFAEILTGAGVFTEALPNGFAIGRVAADEAELLTLAVDPGAQRRGAGRALLARFEATAAVRGATTAFLEVAADNAPARALYSGAGWTEAGRRRGYYARKGGGAADALVLRKALAGPG